MAINWTDIQADLAGALERVTRIVEGLRAEGAPEPRATVKVSATAKPNIGSPAPSLAARILGTDDPLKSRAAKLGLLAGQAAAAREVLRRLQADVDAMAREGG
jgi:hypothetical protein